MRNVCPPTALLESRTLDRVWMIYSWIDDLAGPYGAANVVSGAIIGAIYWVLSASR
jgi:hypothetical protein